ncbi:amino acid ABC transporter permease [Halosegnis marinus]|uniref:Amino acid ABC transporter permease n=1 Tax=Halosegnis marinus TaxID=3034023 RepID=A0ABD5ZKX5_9EURY|nr:amino acid ABC transporter permease [Halosegnis sp. DT85]
MSGATATETRRLGGGAALRYAAFGVFWGYLLLRWAYEWVLADALGMARGAPFLPVGTFESLAASWTGTPVGGFFSFLALVGESLPAAVSGAWLTVVLTVVSMLLGLVIAVPLSVARVYGGRLTRGVALAYTELIRGTPLLAQLFVLYFGLSLSATIRELPFVGEGFVPGQAVFVAVIGFTINSAAYQSEYIRSALLSVEDGQLRAGRAVGLSRLDTIRYVVLPQGLRYAIPGWTNELVYLIKYSSLAAFITVPELYKRTSDIAAGNFRYFELLVLAGVIYLGLVLSASALMGRVEDRVSIPGLGSERRR